MSWALRNGKIFDKWLNRERFRNTMLLANIVGHVALSDLILRLYEKCFEKFLASNERILVVVANRQFFCFSQLYSNGH